MKKKYLLPENLINSVWKYKENNLDTKKTNDFLIKLRTNNLFFTKNNKVLSFRVMHFNKVVKSKEIDDIVVIIKSYLKADSIF